MKVIVMMFSAIVLALMMVGCSSTSAGRGVAPGALGSQGCASQTGACCDTDCCRDCCGDDCADCCGPDCRDCCDACVEAKHVASS